MIPTYSAYKALIFVIAVLPAAQECTCGKTPDPPKPKFERFTVSPNPICANQNRPLLRISWRVTGGEGESCFSNFKVNGRKINGQIWADGIQNGPCGQGDYNRETTISLVDVFRNNIPSSFTISAELTRQIQAGTFVRSQVIDSLSAEVNTRQCEPEKRTSQ